MGRRVRHDDDDDRIRQTLAPPAFDMLDTWTRVWPNSHGLADPEHLAVSHADPERLSDTHADCNRVPNANPFSNLVRDADGLANEDPDGLGDDHAEPDADVV